MKSKGWWTLGATAMVLAATEVPAFACSCARVESFSEATQRAPVVVVGRLVSVGELPPSAPEPSNPDPTVITIRAPFMGTGLILAIESVAKGNIAEKQIRAWDFAFGDCANALRNRPPGTLFVAALSRVRDFSPETRQGWGAAGAIPESDYLASGGCTYATQVLNPVEFAEWMNRKIP